MLAKCKNWRLDVEERKVDGKFGYYNYYAARQSPEKLIVFMDVFSTTAKKYAAPLIAKKYTQAAIDAIATKRTTLITAKTAQEVAKNSRLGVTQNRVILLNNVWASRTKVAKAAKVIFAANYAKYKLYLLPASEEAGTTFSVIGTITDKTTNQP